MCRRVAEIRGAIECSEWIPGSTIEIECGHIPATAAAARISSDNGSYTTVHREWKPMVKLRAGPVDINSNLSFVLYPDPKLRARNIRINSFDDNVKKLMLDVTYRRDGVGLSTPRLGKGKGWPWYLFAQGVLYIDQMTPKALNSIGQELLNLEEEFEKRCSVRLRAPFSTNRKLQLTKNNKPKSESNRASFRVEDPVPHELPSESDMADLHIILVNAEKRIRALTASKTTSVKKARRSVKKKHGQLSARLTQCSSEEELWPSRVDKWRFSSPDEDLSIGSSTSADFGQITDTRATLRQKESAALRARKWSESSGRRRENEDMSGKAGVSTQGRPSCDSGIQTQQQRWQRKLRKTSVRNREKQLDDGQDVEIGVEG
ncbi:hypothetical protein SELMODRAFT_407854 [Selaginella moellendorffii]|uniref:Peptide deformylase n=1 Tax=Selaginella moellendorffii TaxID=88036 RepID=D8R4Z3_SELML|nr:hypothetical protein SELMODRAFT_407854 [Selaginella moellendorffii]